MTILPQLVNISPKNVMFTPKYVDLRALSSVVANRIYTLFVVKSTRVPSKANLGNARIFTASVTATPPLWALVPKIVSWEAKYFDENCFMGGKIWEDKYGRQCVTVPKILDDTDTDTFFRH